MPTHLTGARGQSTPAVSHLTSARGRSSSTARSHLTRAVGKQLAAVNVEAGLAQVLEPFQIAELNAVNVTAGVQVDSWKWELVSTTNPKVGTVTIASDGASAARYLTPPTLVGAALTFRVTARVPGQPDSTDTVVHTIRPHGGFWMPISGTYVPVNLTPPTASDPSGTTGLGLSPLGTSPLGA